MNFIKQNFQFLVMMGLLLLVLWQRIFTKGDSGKPSVVITRDTVYQQNAHVIPSYQPVIIETSKPVMTPAQIIQYTPDTNIAGLRKQVEHLRDLYFQQVISKDTIRLDSIGYVAVSDTVTQNRIAARGVSYNYRIPTIYERTVITNPSRRQVFVGGGVYGSTDLSVGRFDVGILYKNRKDQIFLAKRSMSNHGNMGFGIESYWKIRLRRK